MPKDDPPRAWRSGFPGEPHGSRAWCLALLVLGLSACAEAAPGRPSSTPDGGHHDDPEQRQSCSDVSSGADSGRRMDASIPPETETTSPRSTRKPTAIPSQSTDDWACGPPSAAATAATAAVGPPTRTARPMGARPRDVPRPGASTAIWMGVPRRVVRPQRPTVGMAPVIPARTTVAARWTVRSTRSSIVEQACASPILPAPGGVFVPRGGWPPIVMAALRRRLPGRSMALRPAVCGDGACTPGGTTVPVRWIAGRTRSTGAMKVLLPVRFVWRRGWLRLSISLLAVRCWPPL
jgi:hypothetical protein